jgi:hypothetical protein
VYSYISENNLDLLNQTLFPPVIRCSRRGQKCVLSPYIPSKELRFNHPALSEIIIIIIIINRVDTVLELVTGAQKNRKNWIGKRRNY